MILNYIFYNLVTDWLISGRSFHVEEEIPAVAPISEAPGTQLCERGATGLNGPLGQILSLQDYVQLKSPCKRTWDTCSFSLLLQLLAKMRVRQIYAIEMWKETIPLLLPSPADKPRDLRSCNIFTFALCAFPIREATLQSIHCISQRS